MGYVQSVLQPNETVVYETKLSWAMFIPGLLVLAIAAVVFVVARMTIPAAVWGDILGLIVLAAALVLLGREWFERWTTEVAITSRRMLSPATSCSSCRSTCPAGRAR